MPGGTRRRPEGNHCRNVQIRASEYCFYRVRLEKKWRRPCHYTDLSWVEFSPSNYSVLNVTAYHKIIRQKSDCYRNRRKV
ncbi:unnamed protein product [Cylicocyclus nassatus]|uniref:Uncharacterized protein n=1 Tax=Cylicocyclus nassatus TaxID=53992 RepID=A0AA36HGD6_CYLNA|nr:unnamed protein product [Cylicocyclus nassatus]